jgi:hypothetical protein
MNSRFDPRLCCSLKGFFVVVVVVFVIVVVVVVVDIKRWPPPLNWPRPPFSYSWCYRNGWF